MLKKLLVLILPLAFLAGGWYFLQTKKDDTPPLSLDNDNPATEDSVTSARISVQDNNSLEKDGETDMATAIVNEISQPHQSTDPAPTFTDPQLPLVNNDVDATTLAVDNRLTDEEFERLEALMRNDKNLRLQILEEFRYNTDPERAKQLAALLGPYNDSEILQIASELVYSGDPQSKTAGLDLLSRIQPRSNEAREIAIDMLSAETQPKFLVSTMNVLATPARNANAEQRRQLSANLSNLSNHYDPAVRSQSLSLIGRWDKNSLTSRESLTQGLTDIDPAVRSTAAYAINNIRNPDQNMIDGLLSIAEDSSAEKPTRYAALRALAQMNLSGLNIRRYDIAKSNASRRVATSGN